LKAVITLKETFLMSLPLVVIMLIVLIFVEPFERTYDYVRLTVGYAGVIIGQSLFLYGLELSILPIGELVGENVAKIKKVAWIFLFGLFFGLLATIAEPALAVLAKQTNLLIDEVDRGVFIWVMGGGIGVFVGLSLWRIMKHISIKILFALLYALIFAMVVFVPQEFVALAFDGSGATTGDISVPFILALGMGVSVALSRQSKNDDSDDDIFGIIGIASVGPILTVFIYGMILKRIHGSIPPADSYDLSEASLSLAQVIISNFGNVSFAILPMLLVILPFQFFWMKLPKKDFIRLMFGIIPVFVGLLVFLSGIDFGFAFAGQYMGTVFLGAHRPAWFKWLLLPMSFVLGAAITFTEPAVTVLGEKLEEVTERRVMRMTIRLTLALGIGAAAMLAVAKILTETNILWFLAPLYLVAIVMMKFTPRLFVGLAFDSGGVSGGALTSAMLTPMTLGIASAVAAGVGDGAQSIITNGFGVIALISVTPLIAVQILGIYADKKAHKEN